MSTAGRASRDGLGFWDQLMRPLMLEKVLYEKCSRDTTIIWMSTGNQNTIFGTCFCSCIYVLADARHALPSRFVLKASSEWDIRAQCLVEALETLSPTKSTGVSARPA